MERYSEQRGVCGKQNEHQTSQEARLGVWRGKAVCGEVMRATRGVWRGKASD